MNAKETKLFRAMAAGFAKRDTIPFDSADKLIAILEAAESRALWLLYNNRVKFCWHIARRILEDRGEAVSA